MDFIQTCRRNIRNESGKTEYILESNIKLTCKVVRNNERPSRYYVIQNNKELFEVGAGGYFREDEVEYLRENGWGFSTQILKRVIL